MENETVRNSAIALDKIYRNRYGWSILYTKGEKQEIKEHFGRTLKALKTRRRIVNRQSAVTPKFLRLMATLASSGVVNSDRDHAIDLIVSAFFFACRSCEYVLPAKPGLTKTIRLGGVRFYDRKSKVIDHGDRLLHKKARFVWIMFEQQKNGEIYETRTHSRSGDPSLCPVLRLIRAVRRVRRFVDSADDNTLLCSINCKHSNGSNFITQEFTLGFLKETCRLFGGEATFGFSPDSIGNKSIRSGAAMSLFLNKYTADQIMILGRWKSQSFLDYIRPQIAEMLIGFSRDMVSFESFAELHCSTDNGKRRRKSASNTHQRFPKFHLKF